MPPKEAGKKAPPKGAKKSAPKTKKIVIREAPAVQRRRRKNSVRENLRLYLSNYKRILICNIDNVSSNQLQLVRKKLRSYESVVLVGKNSVIRPVIRSIIKDGNTKQEPLLNLVKNNIALVFTNSNNLDSIRDIIVENKVPAVAKSGVISPVDVHIPAGPTPLDPGQTGFFQALNIATKITRGAIEILNPVHQLHVGERVTATAVVLLSKLNMKPFFYGITVNTVYDDGYIYGSDALDISKSDIYSAFKDGVSKLRNLSLAIDYKNQLTVRNSIVQAQTLLIKLSLATNYSMPSVEPYFKGLASLKEDEGKDGDNENENDEASEGSDSGSDNENNDNEASAGSDNEKSEKDEADNDNEKSEKDEADNDNGSDNDSGSGSSDSDSD